MKKRKKNRSSKIKDAQRDAERFRRRALAGFILIALCLAALAARFWYLQVDRHAEFAARSDSNRAY